MSGVSKSWLRPRFSLLLIAPLWTWVMPLPLSSKTRHRMVCIPNCKTPTKRSLTRWITCPNSTQVLCRHSYPWFHLSQASKTCFLVMSDFHLYPPVKMNSPSSFYFTIIAQGSSFDLNDLFIYHRVTHIDQGAHELFYLIILSSAFKLAFCWDKSATLY